MSILKKEEVIITGRYQKKILTSTIAGLGIESLDIMLLGYVMSSLIKQFHISSAVAGSISTITNLGMLLGGITFGILADRHGKIRMFTYTVIVFAMSTLLTGFAQNTVVICILRFIAGIGAGGEYGIVMALVADVFPKEKLGRINSYTTIGGQVGTVIAALSAAIILPMFGWRTLFIVAGVMALPLAFFLRSVEESPRWLASKRETEVKEKISLLELFNEPKKAIVTISLMLMCTIQISGYFGLMNWLPSILQKRLGLSISGSSLWTVATIIGMCLGMLVFGRIMDKFGAKVSYAIFLIASACSVFIYVYVTSAIALLIGGSIVGFFVNGMMAGYGALISSFYPDRIRTTALNTVFNAGRAFGGFSTIVIGLLLEKFSITYAMVYLSILYLISLTIILNLKKPAVD